MFRTTTAVSLTFILVLITVNALGAEKKYNLTTIDYPNAISTNIAVGISDSGDIVGSYTDSNKKVHGFLLRNGVYTTIDVPGAAITMARGKDTSINTSSDSESRIEIIFISEVIENIPRGWLPMKAIA